MAASGRAALHACAQGKAVETAPGDG
eukprot:COSAG03_NODE_23528_length_279_cov_0.705556_1_plen_25_part_10